MKRAGFGDLTAWVHDVPVLAELEDEISGLGAVERVESQKIIYADYVIKEQESDSEGQLIPFVQGESRYRFFEDTLSGYREEIPEIASSEIYVSPSMVSMFELHLGDEISFAIARSGQSVSFRVRGFYEDPFMGSSMIGMKGFLICETNWREIQQIIEQRGNNALAREGAMLHLLFDKREQKQMPSVTGGIRMFLFSFLVGITNPAAVLIFLFAFSYFGISGETKLLQGMWLVGGVFLGTYLWWGVLSATVCIMKSR